MENKSGILREKLEERRRTGALRSLLNNDGIVDFSSNDYLGLAQSEKIYQKAGELTKGGSRYNGATGSRLLTGHYPELEELENRLANWTDFPSALVYNSGYAANLGLLSCVPGKDDRVLYDEFSHASIRDGLRLGRAKAYKFQHNSLANLQERLKQLNKNDPYFSGTTYVVTESVFSMDGDSPDLEGICDFCKTHDLRFIVDEAHAFGTYKRGMLAELGLQDGVFASVITFGKALGSHGAAVLSGRETREFQINYSRSLIYSTALAPHTIATVQASLDFLDSEEGNASVKQLGENIKTFIRTAEALGILNSFTPSKSAIQGYIQPGNAQVQSVAGILQKAGFDVRPILSPTVEAGRERLRFCLHSFNTADQIKEVLNLLKQYKGL